MQLTSHHTLIQLKNRQVDNRISTGKSKSSINDQKTIQSTQHHTLIQQKYRQVDNRISPGESNPAINHQINRYS